MSSTQTQVVRHPSNITRYTRARKVLFLLLSRIEGGGLRLREPEGHETLFGIGTRPARRNHDTPSSRLSPGIAGRKYRSWRKLYRWGLELNEPHARSPASGAKSGAGRYA